MKIENSVIVMSGSTQSTESHAKEEMLNMWVGNQRPDPEGRNESAGRRSAIPTDIVEISSKGKALQAGSRLSAASVEGSDSITFELSDEDKQKILAIQKMLEVLTGKKIKFHIFDESKLRKLDGTLSIPSLQQNAQPLQRQGWGLEYEYHESHYEMQKLTFSAQGTLRTADGREINFTLDLNMTREFASRQDISLRAGDAVLKDPLVINFSGAAPQLTDTKFSFDLDSDGTGDQISFVSPGSGFLALDLNSDGIINNGKELFGPESGNGFDELAGYDMDGNNWIDENDPIYDRLRIWSKDSDGKDQLFALGQKGIGAIYLGNIDTVFDMKDSQNQLQGQIRKTGIFVRENGTAGTVQHIDLAL